MNKTILVLAANPKNTPPLRLDQEIRDIEDGFQRAQKRDEFLLKQKWATRPADVRRAMLDYKPSIVHFCGHGSGPEGLAFEDETGQAKLVSTDALAGFFALFADTVECVVLNACFSCVQAEAIAKHIPFVIGMKKGIGDASAIEFAVAFYDALGAGETIEFAYRLACNAIQWAGMPEHLTPILIARHLPVKQIERSEGHRVSLALTPRLPCLLLLDVSGSMNGEPIKALSMALESFVSALRSDPLSIERVELALITFGSRASILWDFAPVLEFHVPELNASGQTAMGEAIRLGLDLIERRKNEYDRQGIPHYQPIVLLLTDGSPTDEWLTAANRLHKESSLRRLRLITIGMQGADMKFLSQISPPGSTPIALKSFRFKEMFTWLSRSISSASDGSDRDDADLRPASDWADL